MIDETTAKRQAKNKDKLLEQLAKTPIVQIACEKTGVSRATYYRWRQEDEEFAKNADKAISYGNSLMNDMAESQLLSLIKDKHPTAIIFWLKHHHAAYIPKVEFRTQNDLPEELVNKLTTLLYNKNTFKQGQELLTSLVFQGLIPERLAQLVLKMFISQLKAEDVLTRKMEAEVMNEVMVRKLKRKAVRRIRKGNKWISID